MQSVRRFLVVFLTCAFVAQGQGNTFTKVRYNGGSVDSKVSPKDWDNKLTITSSVITLALKDGKTLDIPPKSVTSLSYGQEAHRRVGTMIALAVLVSPVALFGLLHKTRLHYIGVQYRTPDGKDAGILLQGDKDNYRAILVGLQGVTGVPISVGEKDREFIPAGATVAVTKEGTEQQARKGEAESSNSQGTTEQTGTVNVSSDPRGADVLVDGQFEGNCPAALKMTPGKHTVTVKANGYSDWSREITVESGSQVQLTATLEKQTHD